MRRNPQGDRPLTCPALGVSFYFLLLRRSLCPDAHSLLRSVPHAWEKALRLHSRLSARPSPPVLIGVWLPVVSRAGVQWGWSSPFVFIVYLLSRNLPSWSLPATKETDVRDSENQAFANRAVESSYLTTWACDRTSCELHNSGKTREGTCLLSLIHI